MEQDATFTIKEIAAQCDSKAKRVVEAIHVYQAFGIVSETGKRHIFQFKGYAGLQQAVAIGQRLIHNSDLERYRLEDPPSDTQRHFFRDLCEKGAKELGLPASQRGKDSLIMQSWRFLILKLWLGQHTCTVNRTDVMITNKTAKDSKSRTRTLILKACRPVHFHDTPLFEIGVGNQATCTWSGVGLQQSQASIVALAKVKRRRESSDTDSKICKKMCVSSNGFQQPFRYPVRNPDQTAIADLRWDNTDTCWNVQAESEPLQMNSLMKHQVQMAVSMASATDASHRYHDLVPVDDFDPSVFLL
jgi:hypothetical protein